jgi:hypothetical protein
MKIIITVLAVCLATGLIPAAETNMLPSGRSVAAEIQSVLPTGWSLTLIDEKGKMGHPHGLEEPLFRIDFVNTNIVIQEVEKIYGTNRVHELRPNLRLHFHSKVDREHTLAVIKKEQVYSWDIPTIFGETKEFIIVDSPAWYNGGNHGEEANRAMDPLLRSLGKYVEADK